MTRNINIWISAILCSLVCATTVVSSVKGQTVENSNSNPYVGLAPYVNNETFFVGRGDFSALDPEAIRNSFAEVFKGSLAERAFDKNSSNATNREMSKTLDVVQKDIQNELLKLKKLGVRELIVLQQNQGGSFRAIAQVKDSSKREEVKTVIKEAFPNLEVFEESKFIVATNDKQLDSQTYEGFKSSSNEVLRSFLAETNGSAIQIYCSRLKIKELARSEGEAKQKRFEIDLSKTPSETQKGIDSFDSHFRFATASLNFNDFSFKSSLVFSTSERAEDFKLGLEKFVAFIADKAVEDLQNEGSFGENDLNKANLYRELTKGFLLQLLPQRKDAILSFETDLKTKSFAAHPAIMLICASQLFKSFAPIPKQNGDESN